MYVDTYVLTSLTKLLLSWTTVVVYDRDGPGNLKHPITMLPKNILEGLQVLKNPIISSLLMPKTNIAV